MNRAAWGLGNAVLLSGLLILGMVAWTQKPGSEKPMPPVPTWRQITLDTAMWLSGYTDREDWTGCEYKEGMPFLARCPDGFTLEIR